LVNHGWGNIIVSNVVVARLIDFILNLTIAAAKVKDAGKLVTFQMEFNLTLNDCHIYLE
jgi:hypothetical protein